MGGGIMKAVYSVVRAIQALLFLGSFVLVYRIYAEKTTTKQKLLLLASIGAVINVYGYLEALSVVSLQSSQWAMRAQNVSTLLFMTAMLYLLLLLCDIRLKKWQTAVFWIFNAPFLTLLFLDESIQFLFHSYSFREEFLAVQIRFALHPFGYVYMAYLVLLAAAILYVGIFAYRNKKYDDVILVIACLTVLPNIMNLLMTAGVTGGFDFGPTLRVLACGLVYHYNKSHPLLDDGQIAREVILDELSEGYIILDSERTVRSYNTIAALLYPELELEGEREVIAELIYLHNHDMLQHNGKICNIVVSELEAGGTLVGYVMWMYDCTDEYNYMRELESIREKAATSAQTRDLFLHHMTHGFGSPLHVIKKRSDTIFQDERVSEDVREKALEILEAGQKLEAMVAVMKDYSREDDSLSEKENSYLTGDLVQSLRGIVEERKQGRCHSAVVTVDPQLPVGWYGDRRGIERVVQGILWYADMTSKVSGIALNITSEMRYADELLILTLSLKDNGVTANEWEHLATMTQKAGARARSEVNYIPYTICRRILMEMKGSMECSVAQRCSKISLMIQQRVIDSAPYGA